MNQRGYIVFNRAGAPDSDGWYHIMPVGEHPGIAVTGNGKSVKITQVIDEVALNRIMEHFNGLKADPEWEGYLVGKEHFAQDPDGDSSAFAWGMELQVRNSEAVPERERGVWARLEKTELGKKASGYVYKFFSTVNDLEHLSRNRYRPITIEDIGLTNKPMFKTLVPARNRDRNPQEGEMPLLDTLRTLLRKPDASEDEITSEVQRVLNRSVEVDTLTKRATDAETERDELKTKVLNREADEFVEKHKAKIADPEKMKALFVKNREAAEEAIGLVKEPEGKPTRVLNRDDGKPPKNGPTQDNQPTAAEKARVARIHNRAQAIAKAEGISFTQAWNRAKAEEPAEE